MNIRSRNIIALILTGVWVNASEFIRNEILLKAYWVDHYQSLGMIFPSEPANGMIWIAWGFLFALAIFLISRKFNLIQTALIAWLMAFVPVSYTHLDVYKRQILRSLRSLALRQ